MTNFIEPGATVGIIGGGAAALQLVRAAHNLGMHAAVLARTNGDAALTEAEFPLVGRSTDVDALQQLRDLSSVITYIDESVADATTIDDLVPADKVPGGTDFLAMTQDRYLEKVFLEDLNMNVLPYAQVVTADDIDKAVNAVGFPSILKPIQKGIGQDQQLALTNDADIWRAKGLLEKRPYIVEAWLDQPREFAITPFALRMVCRCSLPSKTRWRSMNSSTQFCRRRLIVRWPTKWNGLRAKLGSKSPKLGCSRWSFS